MKKLIAQAYITISTAISTDRLWIFVPMLEQLTPVVKDISFFNQTESTFRPGAMRFGFLLSWRSGLSPADLDDLFLFYDLQIGESSRMPNGVSIVM